MKKFFQISFVLIVAVAFVFLSWKSSDTYKGIKCQDVGIQVDEESGIRFLNKEMIAEMLLEKQDSLQGKRYEDINIYLLEEFLNAHPNIDKAELYLTINGELCVDVKQRKPLVRVFELDESYYLDSNFDRFSLSNVFSARVLQVYWSETTEARKESLRLLMKRIESDAFLKAQITAVEFDENDDLMVYPRVGNHKIILGSSKDLDSKFEKLKVFYSQGLEKVGWDRYSHINLKFENQIVCTKR